MSTSDSVRQSVLSQLSKCRGKRAYGVVLLSCFTDEPRTERRLHNVCVPLFRNHLIEKVRGMYSLTSAGIESLGAGN